MKPLAAIFAIVFPAMTSMALKAADVEIKDQYARAVPAVSKNSAAFLTITNKGKQDIKLVSADSASAARVELHGHKHEGNMMKMFELEDIDIPAGKTESLKSGGNHIMLMGLKRPMEAGGEVDITLHFSDGDAVDVKVPVKDLRQQTKDAAHDSAMKHGEMNHGSMDHGSMDH
ncbi:MULTISPECIES: copper chaperone PCu(A)C [unclassified Endozoicomonas]|uniref:copper chaperone PCu(A)C n=1 Tax=unclassified Endozoicomonas TaxID=2644528 RepID=UPI0021488CF3|nr:MULTISPECIES: copper chaperone PCu(A)C [unclassified Endozoicomonas]